MRRFCFSILILCGLLGAPLHSLAAPTADQPTPTPAAPTGEAVRLSLADLGYDEKSLTSPCSGTQYTFRLPLDWRVTDGLLDLEYSYTYIPLTTDEPPRSYFGDLQVSLDGRPLAAWPLYEPHQEHRHWRVPLPPATFNDDPGGRRTLDIALEAAVLCNVPHRGTLVIHSTSALELRYRLVPLTPDLGDYPRPFYQRSFDPDLVYFVLPERPSAAEVQAAADIAARLGELTSGMVLSATTDAALLGNLRAGRVISTHLIVVGQPATNRLTRWLDEHGYLPLATRPATSSMSLRGPTAPPETTAGGGYGYTVTITNTGSAPLNGLTLTFTPPGYAVPGNCDPPCAVTDEGVRWRPVALPPNDSAAFHVTVGFTATLPASLTRPSDSRAVLRGPSGEPLNAVALAADSDAPEALTPAGSDLFVWEGRPLPPTDGLLQEIISPWNPRRAVLVVTGGDETAIRKAGMALGLAGGLPFLSGPVAQVWAVRPLAPAASSPTDAFTLADLGYTDKTLYGGAYMQSLSYRFSIPLDWEPTADATFRLRFSHAATLDGDVSTLTVLLNGTPLAGIPLDEGNAVHGDVEIPLPPERIRRGTNNEITVQAWLEADRTACERINRQQIWLTVYGDSALSIPHQEQKPQRLDLHDFPYPFDEQADLSTVLFVLPASPTSADVETLLKVAVLLGDAADGDGALPRVALGDDLDEATLSRYHLILIGRPSRHQLLSRINDRLPQPFIPGSDLVEQQVGAVYLRLPEEVRLGYLQEMPSPWNRERALLLIAGTTDEGVSWAAAALGRAWKLHGNLAVVRAGGAEVETVDTRGLTAAGQAAAVATAIPELSPAATATLTPTTSPAATATPSPTAASGATGHRHPGLPLWAKGVVGFTGLLVVAIGVGAIYRVWRRRSPR